ncbi:Lrp/AsnC family transcriptional regulator, partial [Vibrio cyclitrophicus]
MDRIDRHLLELLQKDGRLTTAELADEVGLSASPCARRIKRLEEKGIIDGYRVSLSREQVG